MRHELFTVLGISFIFVASALGAAVVFLFKKAVSPKLNAAFLGFASGVMLAASVWSLLLPAIEQAEISWQGWAVIPICFGLGLGGILLCLIEYLIKGLSQSKNGVFDKTTRLFLAVTLHNIPEGLAVGFAFGFAYISGDFAAYASALGLAVGIGIQNLPEGAALALPLKTALSSPNKAFLFGGLSGFVEPLFAVLGYFLAAQLQILQPWLLSFAAGAMLFVVAEDLLPDSRIEDSPKIGAVGFLLGFIVMMVLDVVLG